MELSVIPGRVSRYTRLRIAFYLDQCRVRLDRIFHYTKKVVDLDLKAKCVVPGVVSS